nr:deoxyribonuclease IV [Geotoga petraea]
MYFGAHMKISNGIENVPKKTIDIGANTFQIFVKSPRTWGNPSITQESAEKFKKNMKKHNLSFDKVLVHSNYLINLASPKDDTWKNSINSMAEEIKAVQSLGITHYNIHCGSHLGKGEEYAVNRITEGLERVYDSLDLKLNICLENSSKKGNNYGFKIEHIGKLFENFKNSEKLKVVYDTCHGFDGNYDIRNDNDVEKLLELMSNSFGIENLRFIHLNDSKSPLNMGKDRHEKIGKGYIGKDGISNIINHSKLKNIPFILETPCDDEEHKEEIKLLKSWL